ncbi:DNA endonuclease RBBP8-like [Copidosoma floridanum]|uniref:DNA endonuclease RBBP8-like n=1 Tax=Copidosoma floridanum TaxID=29053 RepID=UPI0006C9C5B3|nr:DNA endonuclease RBBP8-like [Copidosoma floridanum]
MGSTVLKKTMDWRPVLIEPNLQLASELMDDELKQKYYDQNEETNLSLENFTHQLEDVFLFCHKLAEERNRYYVLAERCMKYHCKSHQQKQDRHGKSEVIPTNVTSNLEVTPPRNYAVDKKAGDNVGVKNFFAQKEDICDIVPIYTEDFNSDVEEGSFNEHKSPPRPAANNSNKLHKSPILSKSRRCSSKKNNNDLSVSNTSITSSNDGKISCPNTPINLEKSGGNKIDDDKFDREPLHEIENNVCTTPKRQNKNDIILGLSKINYGKTEFTEKCKKLRQSKLTLRKIIPVIDISKNDADENKNSQSKECNSSWSETFFNNDNASKSNDNKKETNFKINVSSTCVNKEPALKDDSASWIAKSNVTNKSACEDELVEKSPSHSETSKLRNKLSMKMPDTNKSKPRHTTESSDNVKNLKNSKLLTNECKTNTTNQRRHDSKNNYNVFSKPTTSNQANELGRIFMGEKRKSFECEKTLSDETFFSPAEITDHRNRNADFQENVTDFENKKKSASPPTKKMLMSNFDVVPKRKDKSPKFAYKEAPVRKKSERALLPGWSCRDCEKWYDDLPENEKRIRQNECSRHRGKYKAHNLTPDSFWNPEFEDDGYNYSFD